MTKHTPVAVGEIAFIHAGAQIFSHPFPVLSSTSLDRAMRAALVAFRKECPFVSLFDDVTIEVRRIAV